MCIGIGIGIGIYIPVLALMSSPGIDPEAGSDSWDSWDSSIPGSRESTNAVWVKFDAGAAEAGYPSNGAVELTPAPALALEELKGLGGLEGLEGAVERGCHHV